MIVNLLTEHHLEFLSLKEGCTGSSESTLVKMSNCWKSHGTAHFILIDINNVMFYIICDIYVIVFTNIFLDNIL